MGAAEATPYITLITATVVSVSSVPVVPAVVSTIIPPIVSAVIPSIVPAVTTRRTRWTPPVSAIIKIVRHGNLLFYL